MTDREKAIRDELDTERELARTEIESFKQRLEQDPDGALEWSVEGAMDATARLVVVRHTLAVLDGQQRASTVDALASGYIADALSAKAGASPNYTIRGRVWHSHWAGKYRPMLVDLFAAAAGI